MTNIGLFLDVFVSKDQGRLCIDIDVSSPVHGTAWIRISREVTQWSRQSSTFAQDIEGMDTVLINGGAVVAHAQPRAGSVHRETGHCHHRPNRLHPGQPGSARLGIRRPVAFQSPSVLPKDTSQPREIPIGERRWYTQSKRRKKFARAKDDLEFARVPRLEPHFHDVCGACQMALSHAESSGKFPKHRPKVHSRAVVGTI